jgi:prepilin-type N-terminal cleavage/methylation domain-containing protein/prepilin-type processing-associated H-X9-DG protein
VEERLATRIAQTGNRLTRNPRRVHEELAALERDLDRLPAVLTEYRDACHGLKKHHATDTLDRAARTWSMFEKLPKDPKSLTKQAFTLVEVLVVVVIIAILAALLLPSIRRMQENAGAVQCASNLRKIFTYINQYVGDNNGCLPAGNDRVLIWYQRLTPYFGFNYVQTNDIQQPGLKVFVCPQSNYPRRLDWKAMGLSYGMNGSPMTNSGSLQWGTNRVVNMPRPLSRTILLAERWCSPKPDPNGLNALGADNNWSVAPPYTSLHTPNTTKESLRVKHVKSSNYLFFDGHIERLEPAQTYPDGKDAETDLWRLK